MNNVFELRGELNSSKPKKSRRVPPLKGLKIEADTIRKFRGELEEIRRFWESEKYLDGALVSIHYKRVIPKSSRVNRILGTRSKPSSKFICGAKYEGFDENSIGKSHIITYYISIEQLTDTIELLRFLENITIARFEGTATEQKINEIKPFFKREGYSYSEFVQGLVDLKEIESFSIEKEEIHENGNHMLSFYKTSIDLERLFEKLNIDPLNIEKIDEQTFVFSKHDMDVILKEVPYLVSMGLQDLNEVCPIPFQLSKPIYELKEMPDPRDEPVIGVIDMHFKKGTTYFDQWVDYKRVTSDEIELDDADYEHGTRVSSIIVDGPNLNPHLEDHCGRFRVRHFGIGASGRLYNSTALKQIRDIVENNLDIKVWNISLGSELEVSRNYMSVQGALLDELQFKYDILFIVAGTNKPESTGNASYRIGSPADSLNSIVVNSVSLKREVPPYARKGPVLSFFIKPDVSYYGGTEDGPVHVVSASGGVTQAMGTSYAAPWIARKASYLIDKMGISREVAKALLIDSAAGWGKQQKFDVGYGIVPVSIYDVLRSKDDEIRFVMSGKMRNTEIYTYRLPVNMIDGKHPFKAKITMTYFPKCDRYNGVDYSCTELDVHFGRVYEDKKGSFQIKSIDANHQGEDGIHVCYEETARKTFRKWDNVKHLEEKVNERSKDVKAMTEKGFWGIKINERERQDEKYGEDIDFGIVITLKEIHDENRYMDFINRCIAYGWIVNEIDIEHRTTIYNVAEEEIEWD